MTVYITMYSYAWTNVILLGMKVIGNGRKNTLTTFVTVFFAGIGTERMERKKLVGKMKSEIWDAGNDIFRSETCR
jgi:hypothetical protein